MSGTKEAICERDPVSAVFAAKVYLKWTEAKWKSVLWSKSMIFLFLNMGAAPSGQKKIETRQLIISAQFCKFQKSASPMV